jgi:hypothetical protein
VIELEEEALISEIEQSTAHRCWRVREDLARVEGVLNRSKRLVTVLKSAKNWNRILSQNCVIFCTALLYNNPVLALR